MPQTPQGTTRNSFYKHLTRTKKAKGDSSVEYLERPKYMKVEPGIKQSHLHMSELTEEISDEFCGNLDTDAFVDPELNLKAFSENLSVDTVFNDIITVHTISKFRVFVGEEEKLGDMSNLNMLIFRMVGPSGLLVKVEMELVKEEEKFVLECSYVPLEVGVYIGEVTVADRFQVTGSPFFAIVSRDFGIDNSKHPIHSFNVNVKYTFKMFRHKTPWIQTNYLRTISDITTNPKTSEFYLADEKNSEIVVFSWVGKLKRIFGGKGMVPGHLDSPKGISYDEVYNRVFVADTGNSRISIFTPEGDYVGDFPPQSKRSDGFIGFDSPTGISVAYDGSRVAVADSLQVHLFTRAGKYEGGIAFMNHENGGFIAFGTPYSVKFDLNSENVFVSDGKFNWLYIIDKNLKTSYSRLNNLRCHPGAHLIDDGGNILVCDPTKNQICIFDRNCNLLTSLDSVEGFEFHEPRHLTTLCNGYIVACQANGTVLVF